MTGLNNVVQTTRMVRACSADGEWSTGWTSTALDTSPEKNKRKI